MFNENLNENLVSTLLTNHFIHLLSEDHYHLLRVYRVQSALHSLFNLILREAMSPALNSHPGYRIGAHCLARCRGGKETDLNHVV